MKKRKTAIIAACIALIALVGFGISGTFGNDMPLIAEPSPSQTSEAESAALPAADLGTSAPAEKPSPTAAPESTATPAPETNGTAQNPQGSASPGGARSPAGGNQPQGGTANEPPATPPTAAPPAPAPAAPDPAPAVPSQPAPAPAPPAPEPPPPAAPQPQPEQPPDPNYAYCSCGAVLTPEDVTAHMRQHMLNGENHHYDTY